MSYAPITRGGVEAAPALNFPERQPEHRNCTITIEAAPDGLHVSCTYTGALESIPAAIERLKAAGILELVQASANTPAPAPARAESTPVCPVHNVAMKPMEKPDKGGKTHWCTKKTESGFCKERA